jgi:opacity protein-like surface antigen
MRSLRLLLVGSLALVAQAAFAQDYGRPGLYTSLNGVYGVELFDNVPSSLVDNSVGVSGRVGYRFTPYLAAETQVEWSGDFAEGGPDFAETLWTANGKFYFLNNQFQPYALVGLGGEWASIKAGGVSDDESGFLFRVGGGVDWYFNQNFGLLLETVYNASTDNVLDDADYLSIGWGLFYRF